MSLVQSLHNRFQRWYIHHMVLAIIVAWLWLKCLRARDRLEVVWRRIWGFSNLHLEDLASVDLSKFEVERTIVGPRGIRNQSHVYNDRVRIEHTAAWQNGRGLVETVQIECRWHRGLFITFEDGVLVKLQRPDPPAVLPLDRVNEHEVLALEFFMERLREVSPLPKGLKPYVLTFETSLV
ncbi:hypothetical protein K2Q00_00200 [Patescibacteria group bacterium]|nr:hypothetical protein [Patescibacteria group bacterium]